MNSILRKLMYPLVAAASLAALDAAATDVTLVNQMGDTIHPWYRSNCWNLSLVTPDPTTGWVFFGGVGGHGQFTWTAFEGLLQPGCKKPKVEFTFTLDLNVPALHPAGRVHTRVDFDDAVDTITVVADPKLQKGDGDDDQDD